MRSAPSRFAAITPHRPTAPSPDHGDRVALLDPGADGGVVAGRHDVGEREQRGHRLVGVAVARDRDQRAVGKRHPHRLALAAVAVHREEAAVAHALVMPWRQCGQVPSLKANGAMTKSPWRCADLGADVLDHADELVADRARLERRLAAVVPEVRAADAGQHHADDGIGGLDDGGVRPVADGDLVRGFEKCCAHWSCLLRLGTALSRSVPMP